MTGITCRRFTEADEPAYAALLKRCRGNLLYASRPFLAFLERTTESEVDLLVAEIGGVVVGALPFAVLRAPGVGCVVNSLPWWGSHGSVVLDRSGRDGDEIRLALLGALRQLAEALEALSTTVILLPEEQQSLEVYRTGFEPDVIDGRVGQITPLPHDTPSVDVGLEQLFQQKTRNLVRKSLKQGFQEIVTDEPWAWDFLHRVHHQNISALNGRAKPRHHFELLRATLPLEMRRLSLAMSSGEPIAAMLTLQFNGTVEYVTPAIMVEHRSRQPLSFLIWHGMLDAVRGGATSWNWGGTWLSQTSLHHFKAGFGAEDKPYSYLTRASEAGLRAFRERRAELGALFPFFFTYPYDRLDDPA